MQLKKDPQLSSWRDIDDMAPRWERGAPRVLCDADLFAVQCVPSVSRRTGKRFDFIRLKARNWVNVVALTPEGDFILVVQQRHGIDRATLEIPAGLIDGSEKPEDAALRELQEETGFIPESIFHIGTSWPNPAFLDNLCFTYLALGCRPAGTTNHDAAEEIEVVILPKERMSALITRGLLGNAMGLTGLMWYRLYQEGHMWNGDPNMGAESFIP
jgi:8-oxo-dGTP pyrophosphatase MutT (NUDIX family)